MGKNKLERFEEIASFDHVLEFTDFQSDEVRKPAGRWNGEIFQRPGPVTLELACGKGAYTLALARRYPERNFVGIDIKGGRLWKGAVNALDKELDNVRFLRIYIDHLAEYFGPGEVEEIWITFPDPYLRGSDRSKRLTSPRFLEIYRRVLAPGGVIHLKTDSPDLFRFTRSVLAESDWRTVDLVEDIYAERPEDELLTIKTHYEKRHLDRGRTIRYVAFQLPGGGESTADSA